MLSGVFGGKNGKWHLVDGSNHARGLSRGRSPGQKPPKCLKSPGDEQVDLSRHACNMEREDLIKAA